MNFADGKIYEILGRTTVRPYQVIGIQTMYIGNNRKNNYLNKIKIRYGSA